MVAGAEQLHAPVPPALFSGSPSAQPDGTRPGASNVDRESCPWFPSPQQRAGAKQSCCLLGLCGAAVCMPGGWPWGQGASSVITCPQPHLLLVAAHQWVERNAEQALRRGGGVRRGHLPPGVPSPIPGGLHLQIEHRWKIPFPAQHSELKRSV